MASSSRPSRRSEASDIERLGGQIRRGPALDRQYLQLTTSVSKCQCLIAAVATETCEVVILADLGSAAGCPSSDRKRALVSEKLASEICNQSGL